MRCPYCASIIEKKIDFIPLSAKRRAVLDAVIDAGPAGVDLERLTRRFFHHNKNGIVVRTTIHNINKQIKPLKIVLKAGKVRLDER